MGVPPARHLAPPPRISSGVRSRLPQTGRSSEAVYNVERVMVVAFDLPGKSSVSEHKRGKADPADRSFSAGGGAPHGRGGRVLHLLKKIHNSATTTVTRLQRRVDSSEVLD